MKENKHLARLLENAYREGWHDGHRQGLDCGQNIYSGCMKDVEFQTDYDYSDTLAAINKLIQPDSLPPSKGMED